jgi:magnesium transporter
VPPAPTPSASFSTLDDLQKVSEVHCIVSEQWLLTLHKGTCPSLREYALRAVNHKIANLKQAQLVYRIADVLIDSFAPILGELDDRIDELQSAVVQSPDNDQLAEMLKYRAALIQLRRLITPQRDIFASLSAGVTELPGFSDDDVRYLRDVYDHLIHLSDLIDSYRDLLSGTTDAYLSVVSNQLNVVMKQLSIIATIFLPLSFLTGFFGQNFGWLVGGLNGVGKFLILGLGTEVVAVAALYMLFRRRGWLKG